MREGMSASGQEMTSRPHRTACAPQQPHEDKDKHYQHHKHADDDDNLMLADEFHESGFVFGAGILRVRCRREGVFRVDDAFAHDAEQGVIALAHPAGQLGAFGKFRCFQVAHI
ncbi:MAG: hypothetical protein EGQ45_00745, partial [Clostridiales bacterium]|nr:hypothetical protein [Clostridiales bacterium]